MLLTRILVRSSFGQNLPGACHAAHRFSSVGDDTSVKIKELDAEIKRLQRQIHKFKMDTVYPVRPITQPVNLFIRERSKYTSIVPGMGSSATKELHQENHKRLIKEYLGLNDYKRLKYVESAKKNAEHYKTRMRDYHRIYAKTEAFREFVQKEKELRKLVGGRILAKESERKRSC